MKGTTAASSAMRWSVGKRKMDRKFDHGASHLFQSAALFNVCFCL